MSLFANPMAVITCTKWYLTGRT